MFKLTRENIDAKTNTIRLTQVKTKAAVVIPILPQVQAILKRYNGDFPPLLSSKPKHNYNLYNSLIKEVCKLASINELCKGRVSNYGGRGSKVVERPKYQLVTSHTCRRTFCTLWHGKMNQQIIMSISGHKSEQSYLKYINKNRKVDTDALHKAFANAM